MIIDLNVSWLKVNLNILLSNISEISIHVLYNEVYKPLFSNINHIHLVHYIITSFNCKINLQII